MNVTDYFKAAHEIKNTISLACANLDLLEANENNETHIRKYRLIKTELLRIHDLMLDLLRFAKEAPINKLKINPRDIIRELIYEFYESYHYSFDFKFDAPSYEVFVTGDRARIRQVFANIIKNTLEGRHEERRLYLLIKIEKENRFAKITISDNGKGFHPAAFGFENDDKERLLNKTDSSINGLGLLIIKSIVAEHDGFLDIQSEPGVGSSVCVRLPVYI